MSRQNGWCTTRRILKTKRVQWRVPFKEFNKWLQITITHMHVHRHKCRHTLNQWCIFFPKIAVWVSLKSFCQCKIIERKTVIQKVNGMHSNCSGPLRAGTRILHPTEWLTLYHRATLWIRCCPAILSLHLGWIQNTLIWVSASQCLWGFFCLLMINKARLVFWRQIYLLC